MAILEQLVGGSAEALGAINHTSFGQDFSTGVGGGAVLIGQPIQNIEFSFRVQAGSPTRNITFTARSSLGALLHTFGTLASSEVTTGTSTLYGPTTPIAWEPVGGMSTSDILCAEMAHDSNNSYLHQDNSSSSVITNSQYIDKPATSPTSESYDAVFRVTYGSEPVAAGSRLPPPPLIARF